jgi:hypothetical protein
MLMGTEQLGRALVCGMYGSETGLCTEDHFGRAQEEQWARFDIAPQAESFDSWLIFIVEDALIARCVIFDIEAVSFSECRLDPGEFDRVLQAALSVLTEHYDIAMKASS